METKTKSKIIGSTLGLLLAVALFFSSGLRLPILDDTTDTYFRESITKAGLAYATCRVINASVSIIKDSSLQLEPAGVGVSLAVGQALDPIDDMTERLSNVLVTAITSLGVQKLAYEIGVSIAPSLLAVFFFCLSVLLWFENERLTLFRKTVTRFILLLCIARFFLPLASTADKYLHKHFFADRIAEATTQLALASAELDQLKDFSLPEIDGLLGTIENSASFLKRKSREFKNALVATVTHTGDIIDNLLKLTFLYVGLFLIQVVVLPLVCFWFLLKMANALFRQNIPVILQSSPPRKRDVQG
jgi:hypothetical protein